jgi:hypothetical protein
MVASLRIAASKTAQPSDFLREEIAQAERFSGAKGTQAGPFSGPDRAGGE